MSDPATGGGSPPAPDGAAEPPPSPVAPPATPAGAVLALLGDRRTPGVAALLAVAAQLPGLGAAFTYDDRWIVSTNPRFASWGDLPRVLTTDYFGTNPGIATAYRPLTLLTFGVARQLHGDLAWAHRAVNLLLHAAVVLLVAGLARRLARGPSAPAVAGLAALVFALHPVHVEAVTSLVGRAEILAAIAVLGGMALLARWSGEPQAWRRPAPVGLAGLVYAAGIFCKENAAVFPGLLLVEGAASREPRRRVSRLVVAGALLAIPLALTFVARRAVLGGWLKGAQAAVWKLDNPLVVFDAFDRLGLAIRILVLESLRAATVGWPLRSDASWGAFDLSDPWGGATLAAAAILVALCLLGMGAARRGDPLPAAGILFFLLAMLPASNLLFTAGTIFAERLLYLPSVGIALAVAAFAGAALASRRPAAATAAALAVPVLLGLWSGATMLRTRVWLSDFALYSDQVAKTPGSSRAHYNLATAHYSASRWKESKGSFLAATERLEENYLAWDGAARSAWNLSEHDEAKELFATAVRWNPGYEPAWTGRIDLMTGRDDGAEALGVARAARASLPGSLAVARQLAGLERSDGDPVEGLRLALEVAGNAGATRADRIAVLAAIPAAVESGCRARSVRWARFVAGVDPDAAADPSVSRLLGRGSTAAPRPVDPFSPPDETLEADGCRD